MIEQYRGIHFLGDGAVGIDVPIAGSWGWRVYTRMQDGENPGEPNQPFPHTQHWMSAGDPAFDRSRDSLGAFHDVGEGDTAGFWFSYRTDDPGPGEQPPFPPGSGEHKSPA